MLDGGIPDGGVADGGPYPVSFWLSISSQLATCATDSCLSAILNDDEFEMCMVQCLDATPVAGLSGGCIACQNELLRCVGANCATECLGSDPMACRTCSFVNCGTRLSQCTGLPTPTPSP